MDRPQLAISRKGHNSKTSMINQFIYVLINDHYMRMIQENSKKSCQSKSTLHVFS